MTSDMLTRRCVVTRLSDLTVERFKEAVQTLGAGAVLILLPKNTSVASLEQKEVKYSHRMKLLALLLHGVLLVMIRSNISFNIVMILAVLYHSFYLHFDNDPSCLNS